MNYIFLLWNQKFMHRHFQYKQDSHFSGNNLFREHLYKLCERKYTLDECWFHLVSMHLRAHPLKTRWSNDVWLIEFLVWFNWCHQINYSIEMKINRQIMCQSEMCAHVTQQYDNNPAASRMCVKEKSAAERSDARATFFLQKYFNRQLYE